MFSTRSTHPAGETTTAGEAEARPPKKKRDDDTVRMSIAQPLAQLKDTTTKYAEKVKEISCEMRDDSDRLKRVLTPLPAKTPAETLP